MQRFNSEDQQRGYKICDKCKENVYLLQAGYDVNKLINCQRCGSFDVVPVKEFFNTGDKNG